MSSSGHHPFTLQELRGDPSELTLLRYETLETTKKLLHLFKERRHLTSRIQDLKTHRQQFSFYDPDREKETFQILHGELSSLSLKELLAFSLIMESQAQGPSENAYPKWSEGEHLQSRDTAQNNHELFFQVNPLLLRELHPDLFIQLSLKKEFLFLKNL